MRRNIHSAEGLFVSAAGRLWAGKPAPRWRSILLALTLALTLGSVAQTAPAQTQAQDFHYLVDVINPTYTLCLDESQDILVRILVSGSIGTKESIEKASITLGEGTTVTAVVSDASIGDITSARTMVINSPIPSLIRPGVVAFTFKAKKAGETTITFYGDIGEFGYTFRAQPAIALVTVENCPYNIKTTSHFKVQGEDYTGQMDWTELTADQNGKYTGKGTVTWFAHWQVVPPGTGANVTCVSTLTAPPSRADITGQVNDKGRLVLDVTYQPPKAPFWHVVCGPIPPIDRPIKLAPAPLKISVPASTGGSTKKPQDLIDEISGNAISFEVVPVKSH